MSKSQVGTAIVWSIGLLFLASFLFLGFYHSEWPLGILVFVVIFFAWGLQWSIGDKTSPPEPAIRQLRGIVTAIVSGVVFLAAATFILMSLGLRYHDNYEHYGQYPALYLGPGAVGLLVGYFLPSLTFRTFVSATVSGIVCFFAAVVILTLLGLEGHDAHPALYTIPGLVGLFIPSLLVWVLRKVRQ